jgi:hypothetical protein
MPFSKKKNAIQTLLMMRAKVGTSLARMTVIQYPIVYFEYFVILGSSPTADKAYTVTVQPQELKIDYFVAPFLNEYMGILLTY